MAYKDINIKNEEDIKKLLNDIASRKEFIVSSNNGTLSLHGLRLHGAQLFVNNFQNYNTNYSRLLINWQTGTGKSIAAISIGNEFIKQFKKRELVEENTPTVFVISFTVRETIQEDMLKYHEFGFISVEEINQLRSMKANNEDTSMYTGIIKRRITDKTRGGYYQFYGYKEFANALFKITKKGEEKKVNTQGLYTSQESFNEKLMDAVKNEYIIINDELMQELENGLIIADEIHNVYNIQEKNNYGIAIQYVLDALHEKAPRAVFMSATPMTGNAGEVVDLLNLLVPKKMLKDEISLKRSDFFERVLVEEEDEIIGTKLKEGALEKISYLSTGRVSFLLDSNVNSYPKRIFIGEKLYNIPYLLMTKCIMNKFHEKTLMFEQKDKPIYSGLSPIAYCLYDIAFPNTESEEIGMYKSTEIITSIVNSSIEWREKNGIYINDEGNITGNFLHLNNIEKYSTKYYTLLKDLLQIIKDDCGKIMIYHHRVHTSGVLLIQEMLKQNGILDESSSPNNETLCAVCGINKKSHEIGHDFIPLRFIIAHSNIDRTLMMKNIEKFNSIKNVNGYQYKIIIGSKIIREGLNFKAIRHQFILSFPTDYPTLIQVFGRVIRKDSHIDLPVDKRDVKIRVYISLLENDQSPEYRRYIIKGHEFLVIQQIEKAMRINAIDGFVNFPLIEKVIQNTDSINSLVYTPIQQRNKINLTTFEAYGYAEKEVILIRNICLLLFNKQKVWKYDDLWKEILKNEIDGVGYDVSLFDEGNFAIAINNCNGVINIGNGYYIFSKKEELDIECYLRKSSINKNIVVNINDYLKVIKSGKNFTILLKRYEELFLKENAESTPELSLLNYGADFHYELLKRLIESENVTINDKKIIDVYKRFKILLTVGDLSKNKNFQQSNFKPSTIKGYITYDSIHIMNDKNVWYNIPLPSEKRLIENNIIIGYVESSGYESKFKIRSPIQKLKDKVSDARLLAKGAVCETKPKEDLAGFVASLKAKLKRYGGGSDVVPEERDLHFEEKYNKYQDKRFPSSNELCLSIKLYLLALEEESRKEVDGIRWLYLFNDKLPTISALI